MTLHLHGEIELGAHDLPSGAMTPPTGSNMRGSVRCDSVSTRTVRASRRTGGNGRAEKLRDVVILQDDNVDATGFVTDCRSMVAGGAVHRAYELKRLCCLHKPPSDCLHSGFKSFAEAPASTSESLLGAIARNK